MTPQQVFKATLIVLLTLVAGIVGALIAVPIMGTIHILLQRLIIEPYRENLQVFRSKDGLLVARASAAGEPDEATVPQEG